MKRNPISILLALATVALAGAPAALAQISDTDLPQQQRADTDADRRALVAINLDLTDAEHQAFWPLYREYRSEMAAVEDRQQNLIQSYAEVWESATPVQAAAMIDEMVSIQEDELELRRSYLPRFRKVLPEVKVARFLQIENKIDAVVMLDLAASIPLIKTGG
jgi:Spy/CpxP family protein refolding chaperone